MAMSHREDKRMKNNLQLGRGWLYRLVIWRRLAWNELMTRLFRERQKTCWGKHEIAAAEARARLFWDGIWIEEEKPDNAGGVLPGR